jgi:hypothetical protein
VVPPSGPNQVWQLDFSEFETPHGGTWRIGGIADYWSKLELGWQPPEGALDRPVVLRLARHRRNLSLVSSQLGSPGHTNRGGQTVPVPPEVRIPLENETMMQGFQPALSQSLDAIPDGSKLLFHGFANVGNCEATTSLPTRGSTTASKNDAVF